MVTTLSASDLNTNLEVRYRRQRIVRAITLGTGVALSTCIQVNRDGIWPSLAPTMNNLEAVRRVPLTPPKVEQATNRDMIQAILPYNLMMMLETMMIMMVMMYLSEKVTATASDPRTSDTDKVV